VCVHSLLGYEEVVRIPKGSVFIHIQELNVSNNYLGETIFFMVLLQYEPLRGTNKLLELVDKERESERDLLCLMAQLRLFVPFQNVKLSTHGHLPRVILFNVLHCSFIYPSILYKCAFVNLWLIFVHL